MESLHTETLVLEQHQLERPFAALRLPDARALAALTRSLERSGQLTACIAVPARAGSAYVLLDGYRRVEALKRLGQDAVWVQVWHCALGEGLGRLLACAQPRRWAVIEEALLLRELAEDGGLSQHELARRTGRDVSWAEAHASEAREAERLQERPEGEWTRELERLSRVIRRLCRALPALLAGGPGPELTAAFTAARRAFTRLEQEFERYVPRDKEPPGAARDDPHATRSGHAGTPHQPAAEALAQHRAAHPASAPAG